MNWLALNRDCRPIPPYAGVPESRAAPSDSLRLPSLLILHISTRH